jgi:hypothetical protein
VSIRRANGWGETREDDADSCAVVETNGHGLALYLGAVVGCLCTQADLRRVRAISAQHRTDASSYSVERLRRRTPSPGWSISAFAELPGAFQANEANEASFWNKRGERGQRLRSVSVRVSFTMRFTALDGTAHTSSTAHAAATRNV